MQTSRVDGLAAISQDRKAEHEAQSIEGRRMGQIEKPSQSAGSAGPTIFLHIGTPKSGTTYLQSRMVVNHDQAREQGLLWPGPEWKTHVEAVEDLRRLGPRMQLDPDGPWLSLAREAREWSGSRVLISMEWLVACGPRQIAAAVDSLQPARVEVICTARDLLRSFVGQWQEMTKNRRPWTWRQFVEAVVADRSGNAHRAFWWQQDVPGILRKWSESVSSDRIHLVTVPPQGSDPELLWQRFCSVLDLDGTSFRSPRQTNDSLGVVSAALMQRLNVRALDQGVTYQEYKRVFQGELAVKILAGKRDAEQPIAVSEDVDMWIRRRAELAVEDLRRLGIKVVGDVGELLPGPPIQGREPDDVEDAELLDTCIDAFVTLGVSQFRALQQAHAENRQLQQEITSLREQVAARTPHLDADGLGTRMIRGSIRHGKAVVRRMAHRRGDDGAP